MVIPCSNKRYVIEEVPMIHKLMYFADPMCSWCYGFAPQITQVKSKHPHIDFQLIMGGLRPFGHETMANIGALLRHHWTEVHKRSGQIFSYGILRNTDFVYDTEPPSRAVVTMRSLHPSKEFTFFKTVQEAFYRDSKDTNDLHTYIELARDCGVDDQDFTEAFSSQSMKEKTLQDFAFTQQMGISGFPYTMLQTGERYHLLAHGYAEADQMNAAIANVLEIDTG